MIEVRVTVLEKFRRFLSGVTETYDTEQSVIDAVKGVYAGNNKTEIGKEFHSIIETGKMSGNGVKLNDRHISLALSHKKLIEPFIPEVKISKNYGGIFVTGTVDVLQGNIIRDTKTKFREPSFTEYYDSYQWRFYLDILGLDFFCYDVFEFIGYKDEMLLDVSGCDMKQHEPYNCVSYVLMENDLKYLLSEFNQWVDIRNLENHLQTRK